MKALMMIRFCVSPGGNSFAFLAMSLLFKPLLASRHYLESAILFCMKPHLETLVEDGYA
jgi:hypothetical protein